MNDVTLRDAFLETVREQLGVAGRAGTRESYFGTRVGYPDAAWSGSFVDTCAREAGVSDRVPRCVYPPAGLQWFFSRGQLHLTGPREGDIAFLSSAPQGAPRFEVPQAGVVSQVLSPESFRVVLGDQPQPGATNSRIVTERDFTLWDVLGLGRPDWRLVPRRKERARPSNIRELLTVSARDIAQAAASPRKKQTFAVQSQIRLIQDALGSGMSGVIQPPLQGATDGAWCFRTQRAWNLWLRSNGLVHSDAEALPSEESLSELAQRTGSFTVLP